MKRLVHTHGFNQNIPFVLDMIGSKKKEEIKIPIELCSFVLKNKLLPPFKVYILLKMTCSGKIRLNKDDKTKLSEFCGYKTKRSFDNQLRRLIDLNWIGQNYRSGYYFIRSFENLQRMYSLFKRTGFWFAIQDMRCFDAVIYGAVIGYLSKYQGTKQRTDCERGRSNQTLCKSPGFYPVANIALSKILHISISTASLMKRKAEEGESIFIKRKRLILPATHNYLKQLERIYPKEYLKPIIINHKFYLRFPDLVKANLTYGRRKKIDK